MREWRRAAGASLGQVSERPELWLPGALAWLVTIGWIPLVAAVAQAPSVAELTFLGARIVTSGAWPWNAVLIGAVAALLVIVAFMVVAAANAILVALIEGRRASTRDAATMLAINAVAALPAVVLAAVTLLAVSAIAPREFNAPEPAGGPILRTISSLVPYLAAFGVACVVGGALAAVAGRLALRPGPGLAGALRSATGLTLHAPLASQGLLSSVLQVLFLAFSALLLIVLWAPIGGQLERSGEIEPGIGLLLVGFVAIWLCLVLAGGALQAWSAATWSRLVAAELSGRT